MQFFITIINSTFNILRMPFTLFGYTMNFFDIGIAIIGIGIAGLFLRKLMD